MSAAIFNITKGEGHNYTGQSKSVLNEQFGALPEGRYKVTVEEDKPGQYTASRYRFYFGVVLTAILEKCGKLFATLDRSTGELIPCRNTTALHEHMKLRYRPVTIVTPQGAFVVPGSSTDYSDREFYTEFMEQIMADFSQPPFNVEFVDAETWKAECKAKRESK